MPVVAGVTLALPAGFCGPLHAPLAVQAPLMPLEDQLSTALCPSTIVVGVTLIVMLGGGGEAGGVNDGNEPVVPYEQAKKDEAWAQSATRPAHQTSTLERKLRLFDTCMARAAVTKSNRGGTLSVRPFEMTGWV